MHPPATCRSTQRLICTVDTRAFEEFMHYAHKTHIMTNNFSSLAFKVAAITELTPSPSKQAALILNRLWIRPFTPPASSNSCSN